MRMLAATNAMWKWAAAGAHNPGGSEKIVNENTHDISSIKRVTKGDVTRDDSQRRFFEQHS